MKGFVPGGIQGRLLLGFAAQALVGTVAVFAAVMFLDFRRVERDLRRTETAIRDILESKGSRTIKNSALTLRQPAEDNAISAIREIVSSIVANDAEILYGIYMDAERRPWAYRNILDVGDGADPGVPLEDSSSLWAASLRHPGRREWLLRGREVLEFAAPVSSGGDILGVVRFGFTTRAMQDAIEEARVAARADRMRTALVFAGLGVLAFVTALFASALQARIFTRPIRNLTLVATRIAEGDYAAPVEAADGEDDEIASLARAFETMRRRIREYTGNLERMVEEKVRQIRDMMGQMRDILDNIDQGLFTFDSSLQVGIDHSAKARDILQAAVANQPLREVLRLGQREEALFRDWMEVARREYRQQRWSKLARLAPVREICLEENGQTRHVKIEYQKILDRDGNLAKVMALALDVTESRVLERRMREERAEHEDKVKAILAVAGHPEEIIADFLDDVEGRIRAMHEGRQGLQSSRETGPGPAAAWSARSFRDCHTIKGNAGAFGFNGLMREAQAMENLLAEMKSRSMLPPEAGEKLDRLSAEVGKIREIRALLHGAEEGSVRLEARKAAKIAALAGRLRGREISPEEAAALAEECRRLSWKSLRFLGRKYGETAIRAAERLGKEVEFAVFPEDAELDPALLLRVDEALVHIVRNSIAHGIESPETRALRGKGKGRVSLSYAAPGEAGSPLHTLVVEDDGGGIDLEAVAAHAVETGLLTREAAASLGERERIELIFSSGLSSSAATPDSLSGRGLGLSIARDCVRAQGGDLAVETRRGAGTRFTIGLPA